MAQLKKKASSSKESNQYLKNIKKGGKVFCDASFFIAYLRLKEGNRHKRAIEIMTHCKKESVILYTTREIIFETVTILRYKDDYLKAKEFIEKLEPTLKVFYLPKEFMRETKKYFIKLAKDKKLSLCDVLSYVVVKDILGKDTPCLTFDDDFKKLGLLVIE